MFKINFKDIRPYYKRNIIELIDSNFIVYDKTTHKWVLIEKINRISKDCYTVYFDSISNSELLLVKSSRDKTSNVFISYSNYIFTNEVITSRIVSDDRIDNLVRNSFHYVTQYLNTFRYFDHLISEVIIMSKEDTDNIIKNHGTHLCPEDMDIEDEITDTDNFLNIKFEETDKIKINSFETTEEKDNISPVGSNISKEDKNILDKITTIQEDINETYTEYVGRDIDFSPAVDGINNTFVSIDSDKELNTPFDQVITYFIERGLLDKLQFSHNTFVTLKSHMLIGTDAFIEAGISELSYKNNIVKIKHMVGLDMEETELEFSYVLDKINSGDIYIRPFDMHKGKKIYTVKID